MFESIEESRPSWVAFVIHCMVVVVVVPVLGLGNYWVAPLVGGVLALVILRRHRAGPALLAWVPPLIFSRMKFMALSTPGTLHGLTKRGGLSFRVRCLDLTVGHRSVLELY